MAKNLDEIEQHLQSLSADDWQTLFELIPEIEKTKSFGEWSFGGNQFPYINYDKIVDRFLNVVYDLELIINFKWPEWDEGRDIFKEENQDFKRFDLVTLCKLMTAVVRNDRFCEGALKSSFECGNMLEIIKAMQEKTKKHERG
jgi:hypothetical protein